jgi:hypothetical protein
MPSLLISYLTDWLAQGHQSINTFLIWSDHCLTAIKHEFSYWAHCTRHWFQLSSQRVPAVTLCPRYILSLLAIESTLLTVSKPLLTIWPSLVTMYRVLLKNCLYLRQYCSEYYQTLYVFSSIYNLLFEHLLTTNKPCGSFIFLILFASCLYII